MKINMGFVSNSSTCSFLIYGTEVEEEDIKKYIEQNFEEEFKKELDRYNTKYMSENENKLETIDDYINEESLTELVYVLDLDKNIKILSEEDEYYIGTSVDNIPDDKTMGEFKKEIEKTVEKTLGKPKKCNFIERTYAS